MANIINLAAEIGANFIGDDAQPSLAFSNTSTGPGLQADRVVITSAASIGQVELTGAGRAVGLTTTDVPLTFTRVNVGGPTAAYVNFLSSTASGPMLQLSGQAFVSAVSIVFAASANWAGLGALPVKRSDGTLAFIPVLPPAVVTGAVFS